MRGELEFLFLNWRKIQKCHLLESEFMCFSRQTNYIFNKGFTKCKRIAAAKAKPWVKDRTYIQSPGQLYGFLY